MLVFHTSFYFDSGDGLSSDAFEPSGFLDRRGKGRMNFVHSAKAGAWVMQFASRIFREAKKVMVIDWQNGVSLSYALL